MSKANAEQVLAIEHQGGVLLKAGAGSGKTFVLVHHILYLTEKWIEEFLDKKENSFEDFIRSRFSGIVMMTFTKKAAGEMSIRLNEKFEAMAIASGEHQVLWKICLEALPLLTVTTIDGFCRRLITAGYFPHLSTEAKIIFNTERLDQVRVLFEEWFETEAPKISGDVLDIVIREKKQLLKAFCSIFSDPGLRLAWKSFKPTAEPKKDVGTILHQSFQVNGLNDALAKIHQLDLPGDQDRSSFEKMIASLLETGLPEVDSVEKLYIYDNFFAPIKRLVGETAKKKTPAHEMAKEGAALIRDWVKTWKPVVTDYLDHYDGKIQPWLNLCTKLFNFINQKLDPNQGMTFGDIEYFVALGLQDKEIREKVHRDFCYFIVDEFQDTSSLQFAIIKDLIGEDFRKLFCVGDAKQAIYGFRGGELSVFQDCTDMVPKVLTLANNYRSLPAVIQFNNSLFRSLLPAGQGFSGKDPFTVQSEDQALPSEITYAHQGEVEVLSLQVERNKEDDGKLSSDQINILEAHMIADSIEYQRKMLPEETCTVLYRKLKPSGDLIRALIKKEIGFTAQFKIDLLDDPIMGLFLVLLKRQFDKDEKTKNRYPLFMIKNYLSILRIESITNETEILEKFDEESKYWGLLEAFKKFIFRLSVTNENYDVNYDVVETLCRLYHQDPERILIQLTSGDNSRVSLDFRYGTQAGKVQLMTAHASKGLEFETVYLAGIYTNGRENPDRDMFGGHPGSFYWFLDLAHREKQKSPQYVLEGELDSYKNFSESKRLFYVAATRAKKKLIWADLTNIKDFFSINKSSWIEGFSYWLNDAQEGLTHAQLSQKVLDFSRYENLLGAKSVPVLPLFFYDAVGVHSKLGQATELLIAAELSVTRLNALVDCPRRFYLENILKLSGTSVGKIFPPTGEEESEVVLSSAHRGSSIHAEISRGIQHNFIVSREFHLMPEAKPVQWALDQLKAFVGDYEVISEKGIKFRLFNFMISGIPDLLLLPKREGKLAEIWDFKTGRMSSAKLSHYWMQLSVYAYALWETQQLPKDTKIELKLCLVDEQNFSQKTVSFTQVEQELFELWQKQNEPWLINPDHCDQCPYGDICPR
jgi:ATP-dependent helicase/nuclease subunit A